MFKDYLQPGQKKDETARTIYVAVAHDKKTLEAVKATVEKGVAKAILIGDRRKIETLFNEEGSSFFYLIEHEPDEEAACRRAVDLAKSKKKSMLMKGSVNSINFLKAVLQGEQNNGKNGFLSHLAAFKVPGFERILFISDGGINISPGLPAKKKIIDNGVKALHKLNIACPKVAVLTANEKVDVKVPASLDAEALTLLWGDGLFPSCTIEGPIAMDVALCKEAARRKGIESKISGEADFLIMPDIQAGNMVGKTLTYCAGAEMAGVVLGASYPIIMTSRAENIEGKLNSIALAAAIAVEGKDHV